jgi:hypothetical protein
MRCSNCNDDKLSKEFPPTMITERCNHVASFCLGVSLFFFSFYFKLIIQLLITLLSPLQKI